MKHIVADVACQPRYASWTGDEGFLNGPVATSSSRPPVLGEPIRVDVTATATSSA